jgi:hypothetical protein
MRYGDYRVLAQHSHEAGGLRVWVEHVPTGRREFRLINLTAVKTTKG